MKRLFSSTSWKLAVRNLGRNKRRNLATVCAVAFGYAGLILLGGYIIRVERYLRVNTAYINHTGHISIYKEGGIDKSWAKPSRFSLTAADQKLISETLSQDPNVEFVGRYLHGMGLLGNGCRTVPFIGTGIEPEIDRRIRSHPEVLEWTAELAGLKAGKGLWEYPVEQGVVAMTDGLARLVGKPKVLDELPARGPSSAVEAVLQCSSSEASRQIRGDSNVQLAGQTFTGSLGAVDADIVARYTTGMALMEDSDLTAPLSLLQKLYDTDAVTYMAVFLKDDSHLDRQVDRLRAKLAAQGLHVTVYPFNDEAIGMFYVGGVNFLLVMGAFFVFLIFGAVVLSVVNSMTMSLIERTREFGTLRSIGFTPKALAAILMKEGFALALFSLGVGSLFALLVARVVNGLNIRFHSPGIAGDMQFVVTPNFALCAVLAVLITLLVVSTSYLTTWVRTRVSVAELLSSATA